ncbi:hypothetical protein RSOLAG1IB_12511 [Rhizoctonia solani AG-1 IB]|uniref:Uncharacterized protein n=1 Tax=Thanatephorus cucumeris (strain AG1-IB / isolate 7/3/14) TaxID=1108050 RepID=A0A0B7FWV1_THACB|nr:hypothetical protein RSOLAG1IB_12511 [Rhizoctonia solani AG-1 IB]
MIQSPAPGLIFAAPTGFPQDFRVLILRCLWETSPNQVPSYELHYNPYSNFPVLRSHVHPYTVILNAVPKIEKHLQIPADIDDATRRLYGDPPIIYNALTNAREAAPKPPRPRHGASHGSPFGLTTTRSTATRSSGRTPSHLSPPGTPNSSFNRSPTENSEPSNLKEPDTFDDQSDDFEGYSNDIFEDPGPNSHPPLPISNSNDSMHSSEPMGPVSSTFQVPLGLLRRQSLDEWVAGVKNARRCNELDEPETERSSESSCYGTEPARPPPTND